jgi:hypothetical protein
MAKPAAGFYAHKSRGQFRRPITGSSAAHVTLPTTLALMNTAIRTRRERNRIGAMQAKPASRHIAPAPSLNLNSASITAPPSFMRINLSERLILLVFTQKRLKYKFIQVKSICV